MRDIITSLSAISASVSGALTAGSAAISGTLSAGATTLSGLLSTINATLTGVLTGVSAIFTGTAPATQVILAKGASSQTANIFEAQSNGGTKLAAIGAGGMINMGPSPTLTIASDTITVTKSYHKIDTEGAAATDNLSTINGGTDGDLLILRSTNVARDITIKNGTGNLRTVGDFTLDFLEDRITLQYDGDLGVWVEVSRSNNVGP